MKKVTIYTKQSCPYCVHAKELLQSIGAEYEEIDVLQHPEKRAEAAEKYNWMSVPMILIGEEFIGGYDDMAALHQKGELMPKLAD
ncbi:MAG: glutaredoxin [Candidatus Magasanikbacteria bacterium]|jgi:glutaredoxin 3|nr:glutaredoxin [Candidatus Magasanikbacteria bacterium]